MSLGGLPQELEILGGATLGILNVGQSTYDLDFNVTGITYNGVFLNTISGIAYPTDPDPTSYTPVGARYGVLKLVDMSEYNVGVTLLDYFYASGVTIMTGTTGSAYVTFSAPIKGLYNYQLLYQTFSGTYIPIEDIINPYDIAFPTPQYLPNKLFECLSQTITQAGTTYASIDLSGVYYNKQLVGDTGTVVFYKKTGVNLGGTGGAVTGTSGTTIGSVYGFLNGAKSTILQTAGITFDSNLGDYYMIYNLSSNGTLGTERSSNYINLNPINLPVDASSTIYNTQDFAGLTLATVANLTYNFTPLNPGDSVGISQADGPIVTRSVTPQRSVTYAAANARRPSKLFYISPGGTYSALSYTTPAYVSVPEEMTATKVSQTFLPLSDGLEFTLAFDYTDVDGQSIFSRGHTGNIIITGSTGITAFSQTIPCSVSGNYTVTVNYGLPGNYAATYYTVSFFDATTGTTRLVTKPIGPIIWDGLQQRPERMKDSADGFIISGRRFNCSVNGFDYTDTYGYSIFDPNYVERSLLTGVTFIPPTLVGITARSSRTLGSETVDITALGNYTFVGVTGTYKIPFAAGTTITGVDGTNTFGGRVISSTLSSVSVNCTTFSSPSTSDQWLFTGTGKEYQTGHTGNILITDETGLTVCGSTPWIYGTTEYLTPVVGITGVSGYRVYFYDNTRGMTLPQYMSFETVIPTIFNEPPAREGPTGYGPSGNPGPTGVTGPAKLYFDYLHPAIARGSQDYQISGEVSSPLSWDYSINMNVPSSELSRMFIYQSAWNILDPTTGQPLQGYLGTGTGVTGITLQDPTTGQQIVTSGATGYYGPNVALLLGSVLNNVQKNDGFGNFSTKTRLRNLDRMFSITGATAGTAPFMDDSQTPVYPLATIYSTQQLSGSSGSILSNIPTEAISTISSGGFTLTQLSNILKDIDTIKAPPGATYFPALINMFEEAVAYNKVDNSVPIAVSDFGFSNATSGAAGITGGDPTIATLWNTQRNTFGVNFSPGDTMVLYIRYSMSKVRRFQVDPFVTSGLDPRIFTVGQLVSINVKGTSVVIPLGPDAWYTEGSNNTVAKLYALTLTATADSASSVFD
jgi:hypothetical protein